MKNALMNGAPALLILIGLAACGSGDKETQPAVEATPAEEATAEEPLVADEEAVTEEDAGFAHNATGCGWLQACASILRARLPYPSPSSASAACR